MIPCGCAVEGYTRNLPNCCYLVDIQSTSIEIMLTLVEPANPSDSVKKYANGRRRNRQRLYPRKTWFHKPVQGKWADRQTG